MTREEALKDVEVSVGTIEIPIVSQIVKIVYDDFESRTCENCKHIFNNGLSVECWNNNVCSSENRLNLEHLEKDFGCNRFERKTHDNKTNHNAKR